VARIVPGELNFLAVPFMDPIRHLLDRTEKIAFRLARKASHPHLMIGPTGFTGPR
jgi:hypothetical protein